MVFFVPGKDFFLLCGKWLTVEMPKALPQASSGLIRFMLESSKSEISMTQAESKWNVRAGSRSASHRWRDLEGSKCI